MRRGGPAIWRKRAVYTYTVESIPTEPEGYSVYVPALPGVVTDGGTVEEALAMAREAITLHLEGLREDRIEIPVEAVAASASQGSGCHRDRRLSRLADGLSFGEMADAELIFLVEEAPEGGYTAHALGHAIYTEADTLLELKAMVQDAVRCHFDAADRPVVARLHLVRDELIEV